MSYQARPIFSLSVIATAAIPACRAVAPAGGTVAGAGLNALGTARMPAINAGERITVDVMGSAPVELGGTVAAGDLLEVGAAGVYIKKNAGLAVARALQDGVVGNVIEALLLPN